MKARWPHNAINCVVIVCFASFPIVFSTFLPGVRKISAGTGHIFYCFTFVFNFLYPCGGL